MLRFITVILLSSILLSVASAQDFRAGFVLKSDGDSVAGFVKSASTRTNSRVCHFKPTEQSAVIDYTPEQIKGFGIVEGKYYESKNISKKGREFLFLEVLVKGAVSLYKGPDLFYLQKDSVILLSKEPQSVIKTSDGRILQSTTLKFVGVLNFLLADCHVTADDTRYDEKSFVNLIQRYNLCKGARGVTYKTKMKWTSLSATFVTGVDLSSLKKLDGFDTYSFGKSVSVPMGLGLDLMAPRLIDKSHITLEMWYDKKLYQGYSESTVNGSTTRSDLIINASYLKMPLGFRIDLLPEKNTPYFRAGFVQYFLLNVSGTTTAETEKGGWVSTIVTSVQLEKKNTNGFWVGGGYSRRIFGRHIGFVEFRYERNNAFTSTGVGSHSFANVVNILAGIKF